MIIPQHYVQTNKDLKDTIAAYNEARVGLKVLLGDYAKAKLKQLVSREAVRTHLQSYTDQDNYEQGVMSEENLFNTYTRYILKKYSPADMIESLFYSRANDSAFEASYILHEFDLHPGATRLVAFPCPQFLREYSTRHPKDGTVFLVPDQVVAALYNAQFGEYDFLPMDRLSDAVQIDSLLVFLRDADALAPVYNLLRELAPGASAVLFMPNTELDDRNSRFWKCLDESGCVLKKIVSLPTKLINTTPRKKSLVYLENCSDTNDGQLVFEDSVFDPETREFTILPLSRVTTGRQFRDSGRTVIREISYLRTEEKEAPPQQRDRANIYAFSKEILIRYSRKASSSGSDILNCHYYSCRQTGKKEKGKRMAEAQIRVGSGSVEDALSSLLLNGSRSSPDIPELVRGDIIANRQIDAVTLKTLWYLCRPLLKEKQSYREAVALELFSAADKGLPALVPALSTTDDYLREVAVSVGDERAEEYRYWALVDMVLKEAQRQGYIPPGNPIAPVLESRRMSEEMKEVRNSLLKRFLEPPYEWKLVERAAAEDERYGFPLFVTDGFYFALILKIFLGMTNQELCALTWADIMPLEYCDGQQMKIESLFTKRNGKKSYYTTNNPVRPRSFPFSEEILSVCSRRKDFLVSCMNVPEEELAPHPLLVSRNVYSGDENDPVPAYTLPDKFSSFVRKELEALEIPELTLFLHDEDQVKTLDLNSDYHGDFLRENARYHLRYTAKMRAGELEFLFGVKRNMLFYSNYVDCLYDLIQKVMSVKMRRWTSMYADILTEIKKQPVCRELVEKDELRISPDDGVKEALIEICFDDGVDGSAVVTGSARYGITWECKGVKADNE